MSLSSKPIQELKPDYALAVSYPQVKGKPDTKAEEGFQAILEALYKADFATQVRPGNVDELLVFIKLSSAKFAEEAEKDLIKNYEFGVTAQNNTPASRLRIVYNYLSRKCTLGEKEPLLNSKYIKSVVPVTIDEKGLIEGVKVHVSSSQLSTEVVQEKYGARIALYFEYLKTYIVGLSVLAIAGVVSFLTTHPFLLTYAFFNLIWGTLFIIYWRKKQEFLTHLWGVQNSHLVEEHYAEISQINKNFEQKSTYKHNGNIDGSRFLKQLFFIPIALGFTAVLVAYQLGCFVLEIFLSEIYDGPGKIFLTLLPTILIVVFVPILTIVYNLVSNFAIAWENHDNVYSKNNSIIVKSFVLTFLTSYMPLIITSFIYLPFAHLIEPHLGDIRAAIDSNVHKDYFFYKYLVQLKKQEDFKINQQRLSAQFFYFIVTNQVIQLLTKYVLPVGINFVKSKLSKVNLQKQDRPEEEAWLAKVRKIATLAEYNVHEDFRGLVMQYGYLILFGPVWPLAPIVCIIFNVITFKLDTFKLESGEYFSPPIPIRDDTIHPWDHGLFLLTWIGSVLSPIVTVFYRHGIAPPKTFGQAAFESASTNLSSTIQLILVVFAAEHTFFILYFVGAKIAKLFKSEAEWNNDFTENDIKLRRDYYSENVQPTFNVENDGEWSTFTLKDSLLSAETFTKNSAKEAEIETLPSNSATYLSSTDDELKRSIERKKQELAQKKAQLEKLSREGLNNVKDENDTIISIPSEKGGAKLATIDSNKHADQSDLQLDDDVDEKVTSQTHVLDTPDAEKPEASKPKTSNVPKREKEDIKDISSTSDASTPSDELIDTAKKTLNKASPAPSADSKAKKSSLKKLFKGKK